MVELGAEWFGMLSSFPSILATSIIVVVVTIVWIGSSLRTSTSLKTRFPVPPGTYGLPLIGETIQFTLAQGKVDGVKTFIEEKARKYGGNFRTHLFGSAVVILEQPAGVKFLFQNEGKLVETSWPASIARLLGPNAMSILRGEDHNIARRHIMNYIGYDAVKECLATIDRTTKDYFRSEWDGKDELSALAMSRKFTFRLMNHILMNLEDESKIDELSELMTKWAAGLMALPVNVHGFAYHRAIKTRIRIMGLLDEIIEQRRKELAEGAATEQARRNLLTGLLTTPDETGRMWTDSEIKDNLVLLLFSGHDSSSITIAMAILLISRNPQVYERLIEEHKAIAKQKKGRGETDELTLEDARAMKYTWRVIQETLRVQAPIPGTFREAVQEFEFKGYTIPKGWKAFWSIQCSHQNPVFFPNPEEFKPSRFEELPKPNTYIPFGGGGRMCPGLEFVKLEMTVFMHHLLRNYKWSLKNPNEPNIPAPVPKDKMAVPIKITKIKAF